MAGGTIVESDVIKNTALWQRTLASRGDDNSAEGRARAELRDAFWKFRANVEPLVGRIRGDCPELTIHDISHLDALWEMADKIIGPDYPVNPLEAFLFGGAVLLHDAALCLAGYPGGIAALKESEAWRDGVTREFMRQLGRSPEAGEIKDAPADIHHKVVFDILRRQHAHRATDLIDLTWQAPGQEPFRLLEHPLLRKHYGDDIGLLAKSHWLAVNKLPTVLTRDLNPLWEGVAWQADAIKVACMLRTADAAHVDRRRAPEAERALTPPSDSHSDRHWRFQQNITSVTVPPGDDSLYYTSAPFAVADADAWWLGFDTLTMVDRELRQVHALFSDHRRASRPPFPVRRVHGIESPDRLAEVVTVKGWSPVDAHMQVTDISRLVRTLGGAALYGDDPRVPLRELIQNACDAIRHRRRFEGRGDDWGEVVVRLGQDDEGAWIEVEDNGLGMSAEVISRYLLNFTASYWGSDLMLEELPGLAAKAVEPTGKFGIGFFSVFMLGNHVRVITKRIPSWDEDEGRERDNPTLALEFTGGADCRPVLRDANRGEFRREPGTVVRVWLKPGLTHADFLKKLEDWRQLCAHIAPAIDANLAVEDDAGKSVCVRANDWLTIDSYQLLRRLLSKPISAEGDETLRGYAQLVRPLVVDGVTLGRGCVRWPGNEGLNYEALAARVCIGGLSADESAHHFGRFVGLLLGRTNIASRNRAEVLIPRVALARWADEQAGLMAATYSDDPLYRAAQAVREYAGDVSDMVVCRRADGSWVTLRQLQLPDEFFLIDEITYRDVERFGILLNPACLTTERHLGYFTRWLFPGWPECPVEGGSLAGAIIERAASIWGISVRALVQAGGVMQQQWDIGEFQGAPYQTHCIRIRRPQGDAS